MNAGVITFAAVCRTGVAGMRAPGPNIPLYVNFHTNIKTTMQVHCANVKIHLYSHGRND